MEVLKLFSQNSTASTLLFIGLIGIAGIIIGQIRILNVKLGIAGVLFAGLLAGHFGLQANYDVLNFIKEFGLILFVYSIGLEIGPRFVSSLRRIGLKINLLATGVVLLGFLIAIAIKIIHSVPVPVVAGIMCGAVTNTPSLGAAQQVIGEQMTNPAFLTQLTGMGYAVAYPFGILGIIFTMLLLRAIFHISVKKETEKYNNEVSGLAGKLEAVKMKVVNPALIGKPVSFLKAALAGEFVLSRIFRDNDFFIPDEQCLIKEADYIYGVSTEANFAELELKVGPIEVLTDFEITGKLGMKHVIFTNKELAGKTINEIGISRRFPVNITRIFRAGMEIMPQDNDSIEFGDTVRIVGERKALGEVATLLGNSLSDLAHPNILPILIGIMAGVIIGNIPIGISGLPAPVKLGLAGGPLLVALFLGHKGRIGKLDFYMTPGANLFIRELGITLFLACVGLAAGKNFAHTIATGGYIWLLYGALITFLPLLIMGIVARMMKLNYLSICGLLSGAMTDPPALEFANSIAPVQAQSTAYATVYPLAMFLRVFLAQVIVLIFL
jgi:putative transport protein